MNCPNDLMTPARIKEISPQGRHEHARIRSELRCIGADDGILRAGTPPAGCGRGLGGGGGGAGGAALLRIIEKGNPVKARGGHSRGNSEGSSLVLAAPSSEAAYAVPLFLLDFIPQLIIRGWPKRS